MPKAIVAVPCYNEEKRLDASAYRRFLDDPDVSLLFVNDGSKDATSTVLAALCESMSGRASFVDLPRNVGKTEAVRRGMLHCLDAGAEVTGYYDADLATPPSEMLRLIRTLDERGAEAALASRVQMLGTRIERGLARHYVGRAYATLACLMLRINVYDTQCGAKVFRSSPALRAALEQPFNTKWNVDIELIGRLHHGSPQAAGLPLEAFVEMPLSSWRDVPGSKLSPMDLPNSLVDLLRVHRSLRKWERDGGKPRVVVER